MTEITHVEEQQFFVDEQRFGPYSLWHHQHHFKAIEGGVEMTDIVHYKLPLWILGRYSQYHYGTSSATSRYSTIVLCC